MGKIAENQTRPTDSSVAAFIDSLPEERKRADCRTLITTMQKATNEKPKMWGPSIVGFGYEIITSDSGRVVEWLKVGFSPRKSALSLYLSCNIQEHGEALSRLGKYKTGKGCLYINKLDDIDLNVLEGIIQKAVKKRT